MFQCLESMVLVEFKGVGFEVEGRFESFGGLTVQGLKVLSFESV